MAISWFVFALIATILWAFGGVLIKIIRVNYIKSPIGYIIITIPVMFFSLVFLLFGKFKMPSLTFIFFIFISSIAGLVGYWLYLIVIHKEEISRVTVIYSLTPLITLILATVFLHERLGLQDYLAFPLIITGSILVSVKKDQYSRLSKKLYLALFLSIFLFALQLFFLEVIEEIDFISMIITREFSFLFLLIPLLLSKRIRIKTKQDLKQLSKKKLTIVYAVEFMGMVGMAFAYIAIQNGPVSLVSLINGTEGLFVILIASLFSIFIPKLLKESINKKTIILKITSALLVAIGLYLIAI